MSDQKDVTEVGAESGLGVSPNKEPQVAQDEVVPSTTDEQLESEEAQPAEGDEGAIDAPEAAEVEQEEAAEPEEPAEPVEPAKEAASAVADGPEPPVVKPAEPESAPKPAANIGDLIAVGIISLLMGALMVYIMAVAMPSGGADKASDLSGGVAATVNGVAIGENEVSEYIVTLRKQQGIEDESAWGSWLVANGLTPETLRSALLEQFVNQELVKLAIKEQGITVPSEDVDEYVNQIVEQQGGEEAFAKVLEQQNATMETVRESVELGLAEQKLAEQIAGNVEVTDDEVLEMLKMYGAADENAKSLEDIDEEMVQSFRDQIKSQKIGQPYQQWIAERRDKAEVKIENMPKGLPYDVDLAPYEEAAKAEAAAAAQDGAMSDDAEAVETEEIEVEADEGASAESESK